ncbi:MAG: hypothetical protein GC149_02075 [Gammaproteobacteria bacterium]|nr:hypothetical protein [Gammaproteobacteria bacterium]
MKKYVLGLLAWLLVCASLPVQAADVSISGYASFAGTYSDSKDSSGTEVPYYFGLATNKAQFDTVDNDIGLQFAATVSDKVDMTVVLHARGGSNNNYSIDTQWAYASYHFTQDLELRMGKYKGPFYMISDYKNVGYAYPWVRPPLEVYSTNPIEALSGLDVLWTKDAGHMRYLFEVYGGNGSHTGQVLAQVADGSGGAFTAGQAVSFDTPKSFGINMSMSGDIGSVRLGYYSTDVTAANFGITNQHGSFAGLGFTIDWKNIVVYSEYIIRDTDNTTAMQSAFPDQIAYYMTVGYRIKKYLPYLTYAKIDEGNFKSPVAQVQDSVALGLRAEVGDASAVKFEVMRVSPQKNSAGGDYGLFNSGGVKDGNVYTVSFDTIF